MGWVWWAGFDGLVLMGWFWWVGFDGLVLFLGDGKNAKVRPGRQRLDHHVPRGRWWSTEDSRKFKLRLQGLFRSLFWKGPSAPMEGRKAPQSPLRHGGYWRFSDVRRVLFLIPFSHSRRTVFISFKFYLHPSFLSYPYSLFFWKLSKKTKQWCQPVEETWKFFKVFLSFWETRRLYFCFWIWTVPSGGWFYWPPCVNCWVFWFWVMIWHWAEFFRQPFFHSLASILIFRYFFHAVYTSGHGYLDAERASCLMNTYWNTVWSVPMGVH